MKNYVISLSNATDRRRHIIQEFNKQGVSFEFFDAITPMQIPTIVRQFGINIMDGMLTQGELGCLLSHVCLWQKMIDNNLDYIVVFEDDVYLGENANQFLKNSDWIPNQCHLLKIEHFMDNLYLGKSICAFLNRQIKPLKECNWGTAGYIISKTMAYQMLQILKLQFNKHNIPIDHIMFLTTIRDHSLPIYQLTPAICIQSDRKNLSNSLTSTLEAERKNNKQKIIKPKLSFSKKIYRELKRPFMRLKFFLKELIKKREKIVFK